MLDVAILVGEGELKKCECLGSVPRVMWGPPSVKSSSESLKLVVLSASMLNMQYSWPSGIAPAAWVYYITPGKGLSAIGHRSTVCIRSTRTVVLAIALASLQLFQVCVHCIHMELIA